ncbi:4-(cytidine 5'-diphospho)-2-C-methyl-D-erythritol kinase [Aidingimonas halophila]|uniref:4-diphosphocytidyl-2-C-methyl-D-erythritol kinase n=1 Tax=Aidingimonas halophila TaxID=574349 RepID=A0A1H2R6E6_9GAMM|nr:4-(cytidine 5'-diphospho)-2-C-methyl-D-erythritol kinase [Aidingimonas halophila]GHC19827.1 4-diphosphocytidyl-2-C-methyl-D-erythritol kinase [Aidingimonas halophila]SDW14424.1 4-diphosphocytidyl-2-C-methyl-D-erythritol kinase [Aidingimonas halophila]
MIDVESTELRLPAPAKLNRLLHITGRRNDGYHELQTLFQFLDISDTLDFRRRDDGHIRLEPPLPTIAEADNLIVRAARLLQQQSGTRYGIDIRLHKRLPIGGGLGGGSSNAATTLLALDRLWCLGLDADRLAELGLTLGADVPVFVRGRAAWAEGVGERLQPVDDRLDQPWFLVIHPNVSIATADVFNSPELTRDTPPISMARALQGGVSTWRNDCESVVRTMYPSVDAAMNWLSTQAPSMLTGTGACVFAQLTSERQADSLLARAAEHWQAFKARGCNLSPLHAALGCRN